MSEIISLTGPVELSAGELVLQIPLEAGGRQLAGVARGIGRIHGDVLRVTIPQWLADKLRIREGSTVSVNNVGGKFNIFPQEKQKSRLH
jgi:hypothetical protein